MEVSALSEQEHVDPTAPREPNEPAATPPTHEPPLEPVMDAADQATSANAPDATFELEGETVAEAAASEPPAPVAAEPAPEPKAAPEPEQPKQSPKDEPPAGLKEELFRMRDAAMRVVRSHIDLAKAELGEILDEAKKAIAFAGAALGLLMFLGFFLPIGLLLFLGEWIFGSIGWGVLIGSLLMTSLAISFVAGALDVKRSGISRAVGIGVVIGVIVGVIFGLQLSHVAWTQIGESVIPGIDPSIRPVLVGMAIIGIAGIVIGGAIGSSFGGAAIAGGAIVGAIAGIGLGALSSIDFGPEVGAALGMTVALVVWLVLVVREITVAGLSMERLQERFWPKQTIETTKETIEWVRERTPLGPKS